MEYCVKCNDNIYRVLFEFATCKRCNAEFDFTGPNIIKHVGHPIVEYLVCKNCKERFIRYDYDLPAKVRAHTCSQPSPLVDKQPEGFIEQRKENVNIVHNDPIDKRRWQYDPRTKTTFCADLY
jgi:hypothetical protein